MGFIEIALAAVAALVVYLGVRRYFRRITVFEYERGLRFQKGRLKDVLEPGRYWIVGSSTRVDVVDVRPRLITVPGQEVLTKDSVSIKISLLARFRVVDPQKAVMGAQQYEQTLYALSQVALRELVGARTIEELLEGRDGVDRSLHQRVRGEAEELGLELVALSIKDVMFPGPLKEAFAQTARAKQEGQARLERARSESASLRNLANAAKLMEKNPGLYQLRVLHAAAEAKGSFVVHLTPTGSDSETSDPEN